MEEEEEEEKGGCGCTFSFLICEKFGYFCDNLFISDTKGFSLSPTLLLMSLLKNEKVP